MVVEIAGGLISGSLAILSDAAHLFSDLASFVVAIAASHLASLPATSRYTYGLKRIESLAALFSVTSLVFVSLGLGYKAVQRFVSPPEAGVDGTLMTFIAGIGVFVNVALAFVLGENHVHLPGGDHDHSHDHGNHGEVHDHGHEHGDNGRRKKENYGCSSHRNNEGHHGVHEHDSHDRDSHEHDSHDHDSNGHDSHDHHSHDHNSHSKEHDHKHAHHNHEQHTETSPLVISHGGLDHDHDDNHDDDHELKKQKQRNVNLHAAYLHVMGDLAQSLAVFLGGLAIWWKPEWHIIDPILTLGFSMIVLCSTIGVIKSSVAILLEETPIGIDWRKVYDAISAAPNVHNVHDLHIWCISHGQISLSVHCNSSDDNAISNIHKACMKFGIQHTTIQVNKGSRCTCSPRDCCTSKILLGGPQ